MVYDPSGSLVAHYHKYKKVYKKKLPQVGSAQLSCSHPALVITSHNLAQVQPLDIRVTNLRHRPHTTGGRYSSPSLLVVEFTVVILTLQVVVVDTPLGRLGLAICEDLLWKSPVINAAEDAGDMKNFPKIFDFFTGELNLKGWTLC